MCLSQYGFSRFSSILSLHFIQWPFAIYWEFSRGVSLCQRLGILAHPVYSFYFFESGIVNIAIFIVADYNSHFLI